MHVNIVSIRMVISLKSLLLPLPLLFVFFSFFPPLLSSCAAIRFSPSKRTRTSIPALKSSSQEILSSQADERSREERKGRLGGAYSLASLDGRGTPREGTVTAESSQIQLFFCHIFHTFRLLEGKSLFFLYLVAFFEQEPDWLFHTWPLP